MALMWRSGCASASQADIARSRPQHDGEPSAQVDGLAKVSSRQRTTAHELYLGTGHRRMVVAPGKIGLKSLHNIQIPVGEACEGARRAAQVFGLTTGLQFRQQ